MTNEIGASAPFPGKSNVIDLRLRDRKRSGPSMAGPAVGNDPLRIAILSGRRSLYGGEARLLERLKADSRFLLVAVFQTDAPDPGDLEPRAGNPFAAFLFSRVIAAERRLRTGEGARARPDLSAILSEGETIALKRQGIRGYLSADDDRRVRALDLDVILDCGGTLAAGSLADAARFGVWSLTYADTRAIDSDLPGFWEVCTGQGVTGVTLQKRARNRGDTRPIAWASYPTRTTYTSNIEMIRERATDLVWRELRNLYRTRRLTPLLPADRNAVSYSAPGVIQIARYGSRVGTAFLKSFQKKLATRLGIATDRWTLFIGKGDYRTADWSKAVESRPPPGEYWADPFLFRREGDTESHVFFEALDYATGKGKISVGRVCGDRIVYLGDALDTGYHLSYPHVFEYDGHIWMIPESHETRRLELWKCVDFPLTWKLEKTVLEGVSLADSCLCRHDGEWWLFTNQAGRDPNDQNSELWIYRIDSPLMNEIVPHEANPVVIDATRARNGGRIHSKDGFLIRPAQNNAFRYGYGLGVYRIKTLTLDAYVEEPVFSVEPTFRRGIACCHHLDSNGEIFIFDARRKFG
jgi:hypothetical protein